MKGQKHISWLVAEMEGSEAVFYTLLRQYQLIFHHLTAVLLLLLVAVNGARRLVAAVSGHSLLRTSTLQICISCSQSSLGSGMGTRLSQSNQSPWSGRKWAGAITRLLMYAVPCIANELIVNGAPSHDSHELTLVLKD